ncbi:Vps53 N-terminal domain-containing protein [Entamoeba marina]
MKPTPPPKRIVPQTTLESSNFDDVAFINQLLPQPNTKQFNQEFKKIINIYEEIEQELSNQVITFFNKSNDVNRTIAEASDELKILLKQTQETMKESVTSEQSILKLCDGMRKMGYAKGNLESILQVISHLDQLFNCLNKLDSLLYQKKYDDIYKILQTTHLLLLLFENFSDKEPAITSAIERYDMFSKKVIEEAKVAIEKYEKKTIELNELNQFIIIVDSLSEKHINEFISWMYNHLLVGYSNEFPLTGSNSGLDNIDKRYIWFNKKYLNYENLYNKIIPKHWKLNELLVIEFIASTKVAFSLLLQQSEDELQKDNSLETNFTTKIVKALHMTIVFENQLYKKLYNKEYVRPAVIVQLPKQLIQDTKQTNISKPSKPSKPPPPLPKLNGSMKRSQSSDFTIQNENTNPFIDDNKNIKQTNPFIDDNKEIKQTNPFDDSIQKKSKSTNPFEDESKEVLPKSTNPFDDNVKSKEILPKSTNPFDDNSIKTPEVLIKQNSSDLCISNLHNNDVKLIDEKPKDLIQEQENIKENLEKQTLFTVGLLSKCFEPYMSGYVQLENSNLNKFVERILKEEEFIEEDDNDGILSSCKDYIFYSKKCGERCIQITQGKPLLDVCSTIAEYAEYYSRGLLEKSKTNDCVLKCCLSINTSDYLGSRLEQLLSQYVSMVTVEGTEQLLAFQFNIINTCVKPIIQYLVSYIINQIKEILMEMIKMNWDISTESFDDDDDYVLKTISLLQHEFTIIKSKIFSNYYLRLCHATVSLVIDELFESIFKTKRISVEGAQKMLMGFSQIKSTLQKLPLLEVNNSLIGKGEEVISETDYAIHVKKTFTKTENILKILQCDTKDSAFALYQQLYQNSSNDFFSKIWKKKDSSKDPQKFLSEMKKFKITSK